MKRILTNLILILTILFTGNLYSQSIKGKVIDASTSEILIGATVKIAGTSMGAITDLEGSYLISGLNPGTYDLQYTYIGYYTKTIKNVEIKKDETKILNISLEVDGLTTEEIVVEATLSLANEQALLSEQKNSDKVQDGISEQQIKRTPDASASDVMKRVTGISLVGNKYVFVRGTSERYNNTTLNGVVLPSTDPDKKAFSFDLFPSNLLENVIISKTFTPDQPGNYSGGLVQINTKDFPDAFSLNWNFGTSYNDNTSIKGFYNYNASNKKFLFLNLGIDDSRQLPSLIPNIQVKNSNFSREQISDYSRAFPNNWGQNETRAPLNSNLQFSVGSSLKIGKVPIGFLAAYTYKNSYSNSVIDRNEYNSDLSKLISLNGKNSEVNYLWGVLVNLNAKVNENNKISLKSTYTLNSEDNTEYYSGYVNGLNGTDMFDRQLYITQFIQRSMLSTQLFGEHFFKSIANSSFNWKLSYSETSNKEPDRKTMTYQRDFQSQDPFYAAINPNFGNTYAGGRFFSDLKDINRGLSLNYEMPFKIKLPVLKETIRSKFKIGGSVNGTERNFSARNFGVGYWIGMPFDILFQPIEKIFAPENFDVNKLFYDELTNETDKYKASENNYAGYMMIDIPVNKFRFVLGARYEYNEQKVNTLGVIGNPINNTLKNIDVLPSINAVYKLNDKTNIRAAYSQTLSRPELREIAPFSYVDFLSYSFVFGNSVDLRRTIVRNYDLRYEIFPDAGELISISLFYKHIDAPIEEVFIATNTNRMRTFQNAKNHAVNYGAEIEFRKNLGFIYKTLRYFSINGNLTFVNSNINLENTSTVATTKQRKMQGQSPYMLNLGLYYDNINLGTSINLSYNRIGDRISEVGLNGFQDIIECGNDFVDLTISQKILGKFELKFAINDILNQDKKYIQTVSGIETVVKQINTGTKYALSLSYKY